MKSLIIGIFALLFIYIICYYSSSKEIEITVIEKGIIVSGDSKETHSTYMIYSENEVFENEDEILMGKWNSSDIQNNLRIGVTYKVKVIGWRVPFFSMYRNIIEIKP